MPQMKNRLNFMKRDDFRGELLEVINTWNDDVELFPDQQDRLRLVDMLFDFLVVHRGE